MDHRQLDAAVDRQLPTEIAAQPPALAFESERGRKSSGAVRTFQVLAWLSILGFAVAAWLYWVVTPRVVKEVSNLRAGSAHAQTVSDALVADQIAISLAGGDYGEVQELLARYNSAGLLTRVAVINASDRIVAEIGGLQGVRMGDALPNQIRLAGRSIDIALDSRKLGQLLILAPTAAVESGDDVIARLRIGAMSVSVIALLLAGTIPWLWWQARRENDAVRTQGAGTQHAASLPAPSVMPSPPAPNSGGARAQEFEPGIRSHEAHSRQRLSTNVNEKVPAAGAVQRAPDRARAAKEVLEADCMARTIYATCLSKNGKKEEAIKQLEFVQKAAIDDPALQYNLGLAYFEVGNLEKALEFAFHAYRGGCALPGLKNKLVEAGIWHEPSPTSGRVDQAGLA